MACNRSSVVRAAAAGLLAFAFGPRAGAQADPPATDLLQFETQQIVARESDESLTLQIRPNQDLVDPLIVGVVVEPLDGGRADALVPAQAQLRIDPGQSLVELSLLLTDNQTETGPRSYAVRLFPLAIGQNKGLVASAPALIRLLDDENFVPARLEDLQVAEDARRTELVLQLDHPAERRTQARIALVSGTALEAIDFEAVETEVWLRPGDREVRVPIQIVRDDLFEADEHFFARVIDSNGLRFVDAEAKVTLINDDRPPRLRLSADAVTEGALEGAVSFTLDRPAGVETRIDYAFSSNTAMADRDFIAANGTLAFPAGVTQRDLTYTLVDDGRDERDETFVLRIADPVGLTLDSTSLTIDLLDDDPTPFAVLGQTDLREGEDTQLVFRLSQASDLPISFRLRLVPGTATIPDDLEQIDALVTFAPGQIYSEPLTLSPIVDEVYEENEQVGLTLFDARNVSLPSLSPTLNIADNQREPSLTLASITSREGGSDNALVFGLSRPSAGSASFTLQTQSGLARAGEDFAALNQVYSFPAGTTELAIPLTLIDNRLNESPETFRALVSNPVGLTMTQSIYEIEIEDDDPVPSLDIRSDGDVSEADGQGLAFEFVLSAPSGREIRFNTLVASASANGHVEDDIEAYSPTVTIPPGAARTRLVLRPKADYLFEDTEQFSLSLTDGSGVRLPTQPFVFAVLDDDVPPVAELMVPEFAEGDAADTVAVLQLSKPAGKDTPFRIGVFEGSARENQDYDVGARDLMIAAGTSWTALPVRAIDDAIYERDETFEIALIDIEGASVEAPRKQVRLSDNDPKPTVRLSRSALREQGTDQGLIEFQLSSPAGQPVVLDLRTQAGTATLGQDYLTPGGSVEFAAGQTRQTFDLKVVNDAIYEGPQSLTLRLEGVSGADLNDPSAREGDQDSPFWTLTIADDDPAPQVRATTTLAVETALRPAGEIVFDLDRPAEVPVQFDYALAADAAAARDIELPPGTLKFDPGQARQALPLRLIDDEVNEPEETFDLVLTNPSHVRLPKQPVQILVLDDDPLPLVSLTGGRAVETAEGGGASAVPFLVTLDAPSDQPIRVTVETQAHGVGANPALFGVDLLDFEAELRFEPGQTERAVAVPLLGDALHEHPETFILSLVSADLARIQTGQALGLIEDQDPLPVWSAEALRVQESQTQGASVTLRLDQPSGKDAYVDYRLTAQTALSDIDFEPLHGTAFIAAGQTETQVNIFLIDDDLDEADETFHLILSNPTHSALGAATAVITLTDDDAGPLLTYQAETFVEGGEPGQNRVFFTLSEPSAHPLELRWRTAPGSALADQDFVPEMGQLTFQPGQLQASLDLKVIDDDRDEPLQQFSLALTSEDLRLDTPSIRLDIQDNDPAPDLIMAETWVEEIRAEGSLRLRLAEASERDLSGRFVVTSLSALAGDDFDFPAQTFTFPAGQTNLLFSIDIRDDSADEIDERFRLRAALDVTDPGAEALATVYIQDNDPVPALEVADIRVAEDAEAALVPVRLSAPSGKPISLTYGPVAGSAQGDQDYAAGTFTHVLPAGATQGLLALPLINDMADEVDENFQLVVQSTTHSTVAVAAAHITIEDDDPPVFARLTSGTTSESGQLQLLAELAEPSGHTVELVVETVSGAAVAGQDYVSLSKTLIIEPGDQAAEFYIDPIDDGFIEQDEHFGVRIAKARNAEFDPAPVLVTIEDNDTPSSLSIHALNMVEGGTGEFVFTLSAVSEEIEVVEYILIDGTAQRDIDYALAPGSLIFQPGELQKTLFVPVRADRTDEFDETFSLSIIASTVPYDTDEILVSIEDQDPIPELQVSIPDVSEGDGALPVQLNLSSLSEKTVLATVRVDLPDPVYSPSFSAQDLQFELAAGEQTQTLTLSIEDDVFDEVDESLTFTLIDIDHAEAPQIAFQTTIFDDDSASTLEFVDFDLTEAEPGEILLPLQLDKPSGKPILFSYAFENGTAVAGIDWRGTGQQIQIDPGQSQIGLPFTLLDDSLYEGDETFNLQLSRFTHVSAPSQRKTYIIGENEPEPSLIIGDFSLTEGDETPLQVDLNTPAAVPLDLTIRIEDGTASRAEDLGAYTSDITFGPGLLSQQIILTAIDDAFDEPTEHMQLRLFSDIIQVPEEPVQLTILDNDPLPTLQVAPLQVVEGEEAALTFTLSEPSNKPIAISLAPAADSAREHEDFEFAAQTIDFVPGMVEAIVPVRILEDALNEHRESWRVEIRNPQNVDVPRTDILVEILDNDPLPTLSFQDLILHEDAEATARTLDIRLDRPSGRPIEVQLSTLDATAHGGEDFEPLALNLRFEEGQTQRQVVLGLIDDALFETTETLILALGGADYANVATPEALVSIFDNDARPELRYEDLTVAETNIDQALRIPLRLDAPAGRAVTVEFAATGTGAPLPDVRFDDLQVTFAPGQQLAYLDGTILADLRDEPEQIVRLTPLPSEDLVSPAAPLLLTLLDDDPAPRLHIETDPIGEGQATRAQARLVLSAPSEYRVGARVRSSEGSAVTSSDFLPVDQTISFAPGQIEAAVPLAIVADNIFELTESFDLHVSDLENATSTLNQARVLIVDDEPLPNIGVSANPVAEGEQGVVTFDLDRVSSLPITLAYNLQSASALIGDDFAPLTGTLTFAPGELRKAIQVRALPDQVLEPTEEILLILSDLSRAAAPRMTIPIDLLDQNEIPQILIDPQTNASSEADALVTLDFSLSHPSALAMDIAYETLDGTAVAGLDFVATSGLISLAPGQSRGQVQVRVLDDQIYEGPETFDLALAMVDEPASVQRLSARIDDDDPPPTLLIDPPLFTETAGVTVFDVQLSHAAAQPLSVRVSSVDATATAGQDFEAVAQTLLFAAGQTRGQVSLKLLNDTTYEAEETFQLTFDSAEAPIPAVTLDVTLLDDDPAPMVRFDNLVVPENGREPTAFIINVDTPTALPIRLSYNTVFDGHASEDDMLPIRGTLVIRPGQQRAVLPLDIVRDSILEGSETLSLVFDQIENARLARPKALIRLVDATPLDQGTR